MAKPEQFHFDGMHCSLTIEPYTPRVLVLRITGRDVGEFGSTPMALAAAGGQRSGTHTP